MPTTRAITTTDTVGRKWWMLKDATTAIAETTRPGTAAQPGTGLLRAGGDAWSALWSAVRSARCSAVVSVGLCVTPRACLAP
jgi:hypothetical protein